MKMKLCLLTSIISMALFICVGCGSNSSSKQLKIFSATQSNAQIEDSLDIKDEVNKEINDIDNTINGLDDDNFKIKNVEIKTKDKIVIAKRAESEKLKTKIRSKDTQVRDIISKLQGKKVIISEAKTETIRKKLQEIKDEIEITKSSVDDVKIISNKLKLNILNKNYVEADKNLDDIINVQQHRIETMQKVNLGLSDLIQTLNSIN